MWMYVKGEVGWRGGGKLGGWLGGVGLLRGGGVTGPGGRGEGAYVSMERRGNEGR